MLRARYDRALNAPSTVCPLLGSGRYRVLARGLPTGTSVENRCIAVMERFDDKRKDWQMGKTKVGGTACAFVCMSLKKEVFATTAGTEYIQKEGKVKRRIAINNEKDMAHHRLITVTLVWAKAKSARAMQL